jgi:5-methylcytosine-specific restriction endonuclease McrA
MLDGQVLVLNRSWMAIHVTQVRRALCLLYQGHARAVHPESFSLHDFDEWRVLPEHDEKTKFVHTSSTKIPVPDVILLKWFNGFVRHEVRFSRHNIFDRDHNACQYCRRRFSRSQLTLDHVIPQSRGGDESWENLVVACLPCNVKKGNRTPDEAGMPLWKSPKKPGWVPQLGARVPSEQFAVWKQFVDTSYWKLGANE